MDAEAPAATEPDGAPADARAPSAPAAPRDWARTARRANRAFGPVVAGIIIDAVDFLTPGPIGFVLGPPLGAGAGYWLGRSLGLSRRGSLVAALAGAIYCTVPGTEFLPLGTIVGACVRFRESRDDERGK